MPDGIAQTLPLRSASDLARDDIVGLGGASCTGDGRGNPASAAAVSSGSLLLLGAARQLLGGLRDFVCRHEFRAPLDFRTSSPPELFHWRR